MKNSWCILVKSSCFFIIMNPFQAYLHDFKNKFVPLQGAMCVLQITDC